MPDIVGNIRVDQAWGLFQISGALHEVIGSYNVLNTTAVPAGALGLAVPLRRASRKSAVTRIPSWVVR